LQYTPYLHRFTTLLPCTRHCLTHFLGCLYGSFVGCHAYRTVGCLYYNTTVYTRLRLRFWITRLVATFTHSSLPPVALHFVHFGYVGSVCLPRLFTIHIHLRCPLHTFGYIAVHTLWLPTLHTLRVHYHGLTLPFTTLHAHGFHYGYTRYITHTHTRTLHTRAVAAVAGCAPGLRGLPGWLRFGCVVDFTLVTFGLPGLPRVRLRVCG